MDGLDARILAAVTRRGRRLLTVGELREEGASSDEIYWRVNTKRWQRIHAGVMLIGAGSLTWDEHVLAAVLAGGEDARAASRTVFRLRGIGDFGPIIEVTTRHGTDIAAKGAKVHRTRRPAPVTIIRGIPCDSIEQALLDVTPILPARVVHQLLTTAWRRKLTTPRKILLHLEHYGGRGVRGTKALREMARLYEDVERGPGSEAEADFIWDLLTLLKAAGIERPVMQFMVDVEKDDKKSVDFGWPARNKLVEIMGSVAHGDYVRQDEAYERAALIREKGWDLREVAPRAVRERPLQTARSIIAWLARP